MKSEIPTSDGWNSSMPVLIASNRLPVRVSRNNNTWHVEWAGDRVIEAQNSFTHRDLSQRSNIKFVGRIPEWDIPVDEQAVLSELLAQYHCYPIYLSKEETRLYYEEYCKKTLWPTFHNVIDVYSPLDIIIEDERAQAEEERPTTYWTPDGQKVAWQVYANVNQLFANRLCELYEPGHVIWIQDYHLLLTPSYIIRKIRNANIGLFLHVPFPSSEVFRTLSVRKELLRGMLNADHIGFHLFEYARHFMSACKRILGLSYHPILRGQLGIDYSGRRVAITCSHMAIDAQHIERTLQEEGVKDQVIALRQQYYNKKLIVGVDSIERLKGIPLKLLAFDAFLTRCPDFIGNVILIQKGIHRKGRPYDYLQSKKEIEHVVAAINAKYQTRAKGSVIDYQEVEEFHFRQRIALWRVADVQFTTVLRDGLNTCPFEYIVTHKTTAGVLILSEFSGSSRLLNGALTVNPWELDQLTDALRDAMYMTPKEREYRRDCDFQFVSSNPPRKWGKCVLSDIVNAKKKEDTFVYMGTGFGLDFRVMEVSASFRKLTEPEIASAYRTSTSRVIFLDYYRTVAPDVSKVLGVRWPDVSLTTLITLEHLCKDPRNTVYIVSGCNCDVLTEKFGGVPGLGLVAEHGYFIRKPALGQLARMSRPWEKLGHVFETEITNQKWREKAATIIQLYVDRTNGSTLEERQSAMLFRYGKSDFEFGSLQAVELKEHLESVFYNWPLDVIQGKDYIEVRPEGVGKGKVIGSILETMIQKDSISIDFVLCIGDDVADELMFEKLNELVRMNVLQKDRVFTCTVGQKPSKAEFYVDDYTDVVALLKSLTVLSTKSNRNYSLSDMQTFVRADTRPLMATSIQTAGYQVDSSSLRRTGSRFSLQNGLTTVEEEEQNHFDAMTTKRTTKSKKWIRYLVLSITCYLLWQWRRRMTNIRDKRLISYLIACIGIISSMQQLQSK